MQRSGQNIGKASHIFWSLLQPNYCCVVFGRDLGYAIKGKGCKFSQVDNGNVNNSTFLAFGQLFIVDLTCAEHQSPVEFEKDVRNAEVICIDTYITIS